MRSSPLLPLLRVGSVLALVAALLLARSPRPAVTSSPPAVWATDVVALPAEALRIGQKATGPLEGQKRPPCVPRVEREVARACWQPHLERPPCPAGLFEGEGMCLMPVKAAPRLPASIHE